LGFLTFSWGAFKLQQANKRCEPWDSKTMTLHFWLIPALILFVFVLAIFYLVVKFKGGSGKRTEGRTLVHKQTDEEDLPPS
jgi:hypothetical protein